MGALDGVKAVDLSISPFPLFPSLSHFVSGDAGNPQGLEHTVLFTSTQLGPRRTGVRCDLLSVFSPVSGVFLLVLPAKPCSPYSFTSKAALNFCLAAVR